MKNNIREKIIASVMLSAFVLSNSMTAAFAVDDYFGYDVTKPMIRTVDRSSIDLNSKLTISNGDSVVNLSLRDADVQQVLRMFADQAGMNIIFSGDVKGSVTMDLVDIPLKEALNLVVKTQNLYYDIKANTLVVSTGESPLALASEEIMVVIPVKYVNAAALAHFLNVNTFNKRNAGQPGRSKLSPVTTNPATNEIIVMGTEHDVAIVKAFVEQFDKKPAITTIKVNHTTPAEMAKILCSSLLPSMSIADIDGATGQAAGLPTGFASDSSSGGSGGSGSSGIAVGGGQQACVLAVQNKNTTNGEDDLESLPFANISVSYFPSLGTIQLIGGAETQIDMIKEYIAANDKKTPQAYLEVQIITLNESGTKTLDNSWQYYSKHFSFNANKTGFGTASQFPIFISGSGYDIYDKKYDATKGEYPVVGHAGRWTSSPQLSYAVTYLIENKKGRVLANPKILITSGQTSVIDLTADYVAKVTTQYLDNAASAGSAQVQREVEVNDDNGIKVEITPFISPDGYVTLDITPEYKTIKEKFYTPDEKGELKDLSATLLQRRDLELKGVRIKDGETLVIGGLIQEVETKTIAKIPFLGDLPVVGMFFRSTTTEKGKEEMVIMITPQIVVDTEDALAEDNLL